MLLSHLENKHNWREVSLFIVRWWWFWHVCSGSWLIHTQVILAIAFLSILYLAPVFLLMLENFPWIHWQMFLMHPWSLLCILYSSCHRDLIPQIQTAWCPMGLSYIRPWILMSSFLQFHLHLTTHLSTPALLWLKHRGDFCFQSVHNCSRNTDGWANMFPDLTQIWSNK